MLFFFFVNLEYIQIETIYENGFYYFLEYLVLPAERPILIWRKVLYTLNVENFVGAKFCGIESISQLLNIKTAKVKSCETQTFSTFNPIMPDMSLLLNV